MINQDKNQSRISKFINFFKDFNAIELTTIIIIILYISIHFIGKFTRLGSGIPYYWVIPATYTGLFIFEYVKSRKFNSAFLLAIYSNILSIFLLGFIIYCFVANSSFLNSLAIFYLVIIIFILFLLTILFFILGFIINIQNKKEKIIQTVQITKTNIVNYNPKNTWENFKEKYALIVPLFIPFLFIIVAYLDGHPRFMVDVLSHIFNPFYGIDEIFSISAIEIPIALLVYLVIYQLPKILYIIIIVKFIKFKRTGNNPRYFWYVLGIIIIELIIFLTLYATYNSA